MFQYLEVVTSVLYRASACGKVANLAGGESICKSLCDIQVIKYSRCAVRSHVPLNV
jgi:hypothetical protein